MTAPVTLGAGGLAGDDHRYARRVRSNLLGAGGQVVRIDKAALPVEDRSLLEAGAHLVRADDAHVSTGVHGPRRQVLMEGRVGTPGVVDDQRLAPPVADIGRWT